MRWASVLFRKFLIPSMFLKCHGEMAVVIAKNHRLWRNVIDGRMPIVIITECQELLWRNVMSYGGMSGFTMTECQELL